MTGLVAVVTFSGIDTRDAEQCVVSLLPVMLAVLLPLMAVTRLALGVVAGLVRPRPWGLPAALSILVPALGAGLFIVLVNLVDDAEGVAAVASLALVLARYGVAGIEPDEAAMSR